MNEKIKNAFSWMEGDKVIWFIMFFLSICSIVLIYSAASNQLFSPTERHNLMPYFRSHVFYLFLGWIVVWVVHKIDYIKISRFSRIISLSAIVLLLITICLNDNGNGVRRTIIIFNREIQTFYIVVVLMLIYLSSAVSRLRENINDAKYGYLPLFAVIGAVALGLLTQNVSTSLIFLSCCAFLFFISELKFKVLAVTLLILGVVFAVLVATSGFHLSFLDRFETVKARIDRHRAGVSEDVKTYVMNMSESEIDKTRQDIQIEGAVATGGILPKNGPGSSIYNRMPQSYSDCIFAIAVEEYGALFGTLLIITYLILFYRVMIVIQKAQNSFGRYLAGVLGFLIVFQALVHISVCVGFFPNTGQTLPMVSWGNASILVTSVCFGLILNVSRVDRQGKNNVKEESKNE